MKAYRWTFQFKEQHICTLIKDIEEDIRIQEDLDSFHGILHLPSEGRDAFINLERVLFILRDEVDDAIQVSEQKEE